MKRAKSISLLGVALAGVLALLAGSQTWVSFVLEGGGDTEAATGHVINAALSPVSIALIAAALALSIAGRVFRRVLGALVVLLGAALIVLSVTVVTSPLSAVDGLVTELTGIAGASTADLVSQATVSWWAGLSVFAGVLACALGVFIIVSGGRWPAAGRKYDAAAAQADTGGEDRVSDWDSLSDGADPTIR